VTVRSKAELALFGTTAIWGGTFTVLKIGMLDISPILLIAIRFLLAAAFFLIFFSRKIFPIPWSAVAKGSILSFFLFIGFVTQNIGLTITTASKSAFITSMMVIFVPFLQIIIARRAPKLGSLVGVVIVVVGLWLLTSPSGAEFNAGDAITLVCAVVFALYIVYLDVISHDMTTLQLTFVQMSATACMSTLAAIGFEDMLFRVSVSSVTSLLYLTGLATILTLYIQTRYQKDTTPTRAVVIFTIEPVIASIVAYFILGEVLGSLGILGGGLIILGVLVSELSDSVPWLNVSFDWTQKDSPRNT
jgi:drug/metabolite transporter (DMT)-like permease